MLVCSGVRNDERFSADFHRITRIMSHFCRPESVSEAGVALFSAVGAGRDQAAATVGSLVTSSLMGHDSHGVIRIPDYLGFVEVGSIVKHAETTIERTAPTTAVVDCGQGFGPVGAERAINEGIEIARGQRTACVITRRCQATDHPSHSCEHASPQRCVDE
jgi:LDH2 family malate/lactate/ureidoglycolate dehydrogenase